MNKNEIEEFIHEWTSFVIIYRIQFRAAYPILHSSTWSGSNCSLRDANSDTSPCVPHLTKSSQWPMKANVIFTSQIPKQNQGNSVLFSRAKNADNFWQWLWSIYSDFSHILYFPQVVLGWWKLEMVAEHRHQFLRICSAVLKSLCHKHELWAQC